MPIYKEVHLETDFDFILSQDYDTHYGSCIAHQVHELKDIHDRFGGMPDTYDDNNTQISQLWFEDGQLDFTDISKQLGIDIVMQEVSNLVAVNEPAIIETEKQEEELQTELNNGDTNAD